MGPAHLWDHSLGSVMFLQALAHVLEPGGELDFDWGVYRAPSVIDLRDLIWEDH